MALYRFRSPRISALSSSIAPASLFALRSDARTARGLRVRAVGPSEGVSVRTMLRTSLPVGALLAAVSICCPGRLGAQVSLTSAVDLSLRNSPRVQLAEADVRKADATLSETHDVYIPTLSAGGSGYGRSYGYPQGQPSVLNVQTQSLVFNYSQRDYIPRRSLRFNGRGSGIRRRARGSRRGHCPDLPGGRPRPRQDGRHRAAARSCRKTRRHHRGPAEGRAGYRDQPDHGPAFLGAAASFVPARGRRTGRRPAPPCSPDGASLVRSRGFGLARCDSDAVRLGRASRGRGLAWRRGRLCERAGEA